MCRHSNLYIIQLFIYRPSKLPKVVFKCSERLLKEAEARPWTPVESAALGLTNLAVRMKPKKESDADTVDGTNDYGVLSNFWKELERKSHPSVWEASFLRTWDLAVNKCITFQKNTNKASRFTISPFF